MVYLLHLTDLQLADVHSPGRFEFFEAYRGLPGSELLIPAQRPYEALAPHAVAEMVREVGRHLESPDTGAPLALALSTGDGIDNAQWNELQWYLSLLAGGSVSVGDGQGYRGVQRADWPADLSWKPDLADGRFQRDLGFPTLPGLLDRAVAPFAVAGLPVGWVSCFGNHEGLPFGTSVPTERYRSLAVGSWKPFALPDGLSPVGKVEDLYRHPEHYLVGPARRTVPDPSRRIVGRRDFVAAHLAAPGEPAGHGFGTHNLEEGTAYNATDVGAVRLLILDTANLDGAAHGSIGARQMAWLEEQLVSVHSHYRAADGSEATTSNADRLVVLASHHGLVSMRSRGPAEGGLEPDHPRVEAEEVRALLHRFPNVVLWLNGHRHVSEVAVRRSPDRRSAFAEVSTCSIADWPSQSRLVEVVANDDGTLSLLSEMVDHGAAADPACAAESSEYFASLHRELAANVPGEGIGSVFEGRDEDRNVEVLLPAPFDVRQDGP